MKNINVIVNPNRTLTEKGVIHIVAPAPVCPPNLFPPWHGHWYCDKISRSLAGNKFGTYYVRSELPTMAYDDKGHTIPDRKWWLPAGGRDLIPPFAFFFNATDSAHKTVPFLLLSEFNLFAQRPYGWFGTGRFAFGKSIHRLQEHVVRWEHA